MAYAALISLANTFERLINSSHISLVPPSPEIIVFANNEIHSLKLLLILLDCSNEGCITKRANALDGQLREALSKFEDLLESHVSDQIASQSERLGDEIHTLVFSIDLQDLKQHVDSFIETVNKMGEECIEEFHNPLPEEEEEAHSSKIDFDGKKSKMVGLSDLLNETKDILIDISEAEFYFISIVGMAGIGKTRVAKEIFEDPLILSHFECCVWVTVGRKYQLKKIGQDLLAKVDPDKGKMFMEEDEKIAQYLKESLKDRRFLIVLDDVWHEKVCDYLRSFFPVNNSRGSRILVTTRLDQVAIQSMQTKFDSLVTMRFLNKEESWDLLCEKVFVGELCPSQLKKAGKEIAENCEGLPLMIVTIGGLLSKAEKSPEYWNKVAKKQNSIFMEAYDEISKVLSSSYEYLPQFLKMCFLYMGVFPQDYEIPQSKIINMWIAEGFLEPHITQTLEDCAKVCLDRLVSNNLVIVCQENTSYLFSSSSNCIKSCRLHSSLWYLCNKEARKSKFSHVLNSRGNSLDVKSQRRLSIHNNILFGIKDIYYSIENDCASTARSLLCLGPYHQYLVPICFSLRLLRVLDALTIRFYEFPVEVLKLVQLRYLSLTCNGNLPASISKLWNLQFFIIYRHLSVKSLEDPSYVPIEIWDMQELKHIQIMGSNLPNPNCGDSLKHLLTLLGVSAHSFTKGVLERVPNLKKLGIQIELTPDDHNKPLGCLNLISHLRKLESLKCIIVNSKLKSEVVPPPAPFSMFPSSLRKLHLSGLGYPWKYMNIIGSLPILEVLKLRCYAFRGPTWEIEENGFPWLRVLVIEDTDLVHWKVGHGGFKELHRLRIKHCYKLKEFHWESSYNLRDIEVVDCNPLTVTCANQIKTRKGRSLHDVYVHSSWDDGNLNS